MSLALSVLLLASAPIFSDVTTAAGLSVVKIVCGGPEKDYIIETTGTGVAAFDYDNDGWQDLYFANGSSIGGFPRGGEPRAYLFRNRGDGAFEDVSARSGLASAFWGSGVAVGDYDNDGLTDLFVTAWGPDRLYRNRGDGTFEETSHSAGVVDGKWGASAAFADFDGDGLLDLYVTNYVRFDTATVPRRGDPDRPCLWRGVSVMCGPTGLPGETDVLYHNNGDGTFSDISSAAGIRTDIGLFGLGVVAADLDEDGDVDLYVANDATPNQLYRNRGDGSFEEVAAVVGVAYGTDGVEQGSMGTSAGDYDGDGRLDLVVTNFSHQFFQLFHNAGGGSFEDVTFATGIGAATFLPLGWAVDFFDADNDGDLDLFFADGHVYPGVDRMQMGVTYRQTLQLLRNTDAGPGGPPRPAGRSFVDVSAQAGAAFGAQRSYRGGGVFDFDGDGALDLVLTVIDEGALLLRNETRGGGWASFRLVGTASNRSGIGARLTATVGGQKQTRFASGGGSYLWSADQRLHFGLGAADAIDTLEVTWPSGRRQRFDNIRGGAAYTLVEGQPPGDEGRVVQKRVRP